MNYNFCLSYDMQLQKVSDVAVSNEGREKSREEHVSRIRLMSKFDLLLSQEWTHGRGRTPAEVQLQVSVSETGFPLSCTATFFSFSTQYGILYSV